MVHAIEADVCSVKWIRDLNDKSKEKLISKVRMCRNIACVDYLSRQKVSPTLSLFDMNLNTALKMILVKQKKELELFEIF